MREGEARLERNIEYGICKEKTVMGITEQQNKIFNELRKINPGIIDDGVVDETEYTSVLYRIMYDVLSESPLHPLLRLFFRQIYTNLINVRSTYAS